MKKSESFIESRIRWRAGLHSVPTAYTLFWYDGISNPNIEIPDKAGRPILVSSASKSDFVILCTRGAISVVNSVERFFMYNEISEINSPELSSHEVKADLRKLIVLVKSNEEILIVPEPREPAFCVWNILIMLMRMS